MKKLLVHTAGPPLASQHVAGRCAYVAGLILIFTCGSSFATDRYVSLDGGNVPPYLNWANAATNIQGAIDASAAPDTVWVSNGVYQTGGVTNFPTGTVLTNRVAIYKAITVQAFSTNPADTVIKGAWASGGTTNGPDAIRCVWMTNGSTLIGFTLTNGATLATGTDDRFGGGVHCPSINTVVSNCVLAGNSAIYGGGAWYGTLYNCTLIGNSAVMSGGGAYGATLFNCTLSGNSSAFSHPSYGGGGATYSTLYNCTLTNNSAVRGGGAYGGTLFTCTLVGNSAPGYGGGGAIYATLSNCTLTGNSSLNGGGTMYGTNYNCTIVGNSASDSGGTYGTILNYNCTIVSNSATGRIGGAKWGTLFNCTIVGNSGPDGGGTQGGTLYNCTVVGNSSSTSGGGVNGGTLINSIVYFNSAPSGSNWFGTIVATNTCTAPAVSGPGNITDNPLFVDRGAGDYHLSIYSPALNAGTNFSWMTVPSDVRSKDLDGLRRIDRFSRQVDMGCYELMSRGTMFIMK